jgi:hypothetical protein
LADLARQYHRVTVEALLSILDRVTAGGAEFSHAENMLLIACHVWAAAAVGTLPELLGRESAESLRAASAVFVEIGALQTADTLRRAADDAVPGWPSRQRRQSLQALGERLRAGAEPVDQLIALYAANLAPAAVDRVRSRDTSVEDSLVEAGPILH